MSIAQTDFHLLIGTYTKGKSEGIYVYKFNTSNGEATLESKTPAVNPSYLAVTPNEQYVYAVSEEGGEKATVLAFSFDKATGALKPIDKQSTGGDHPCYVSVNKTGKWVAAANYSGGSFSTYAVMANGSLGSPNTVKHSGKGPDAERQQGPHVHSTVFSPDEKFLFVQDLGIDKIMVYSFSAGHGTPQPAPTPFVATTPGGGPRHLVFHPNGKFAYLIEEMGGAVSVYKYGEGTLTSVQRISTYPADYKEKKWAGDIHVSPDGDFLYASNRSPANTIAIFKVNKGDGQLIAVATVPTQGNVPRNFVIDPTGNYVLVAHQDSDNVVIFKRDKKTGLLTDTGKRIEVGNPTCLQFAKAK